MGLAVTGLLVARTAVPLAVLQGASEVAGNFLQTFGGIYGVIVAFAIFVVWQQHNDTQIAVEREAVALGELFTILGWFASWARRDLVRERLRAYARVVPALNGATSERAATDDRQLLDDSLADFLAYRADASGDARFSDTALDLFHELNEAREHRITVSRLHLPEGLRWFVYLGGALLVAAVWLLYTESLVVQALFTAGMTWIIVAVTSLILDLDDPFQGDFVVDWGRFNQAAARMEAQVCPAATPPTR